MSLIPLGHLDHQACTATCCDALRTYEEIVRSEDESIEERRSDVWSDMRLYIDSDTRLRLEDAAVEATVDAILCELVVDLHEANDADRLNLVAGFVSDTICGTPATQFLMFRIGAAVANYVRTMPSRGVWPGRPLTCTKTGRTYFTWSSAHGDFIDLVAVLLAETADDHTHAVEAALAFGREAFPDTFERVRYLPLEAPYLGRWYRPDSTQVLLNEPADLPQR